MLIERKFFTIEGNQGSRKSRGGIRNIRPEHYYKVYRCIKISGDKGNDDLLSLDHQVYQMVKILNFRK